MRRCAAVLAALALAGCRAQTASNQMWRHYERAGAVQVAVLTGDLASARASAYWIAEHPAHGVPGEPPAYVDSMRLAARGVTGAPDVADAAMASGRMGAVCGACHVAARQGPQYQALGPPPTGSATNVAQQMTLHQWALGKMWDGLTGPSDAAWTRGVTSLAGAPGYQQHIARGGVALTVADSLAGRLRSLGVLAQAAPPAERARLFGELLGTCAACHTQYNARLPLPVLSN